MLMNPTPSIAPSAIDRYKRLRSAGKDLNHRIANTAPRKALFEIGEAIGILHDGKLLFESEDVTSVFMDCCLYDWVEEGESLVQRYAESHAPMPGTDEHDLLQAYLRAQFRIVLPTARLRGAGVYVVDAFSGEQLFIMDINLSQSSLSSQLPLATRTIPFGDFCITGGAPLPMDAKAKKITFERLDEEKLLAGGIITDPHKMALVTVRACLESGVAQYFTYEDPGSRRVSQSTTGHPPSVPSRAPGRNEPCPCGSGKKYKKCCGASRLA